MLAAVVFFLRKLLRYEKQLTMKSHHIVHPLRTRATTPCAWLARLLCAVATLWSASPSAAAVTEDAHRIEQAVENFAVTAARDLPGRVQVSVGTVDARLSLARCAAPQAFIPVGTRLWGSTSIGVRCAAPLSWTLFVPVTVHVYAKVLISARPLIRGQALAATDWVIQERDLTQLPAGVLSDVTQVEGKILQSPLAGGMPLRTDILRGEYLVTHGQPVKLVYLLHGLSVTSDGKAMGNAARSERVNVRSYAGQIRRGVVVGAGVVEVM